MFPLPQLLGAIAQYTGLSQDALEKNLIAHFIKLDKGIQDVYMLLGEVSNSLDAAPGGSGQSGKADVAGLISPAVIAALPPLQTLDNTLSDLLSKLEPGIKLLLQMRDAAEKAADGSETLASSLTAMAVAACGVSNLMSGLHADGGPRRESGEAGQTEGSTATAAKESKPVYYTGFPNVPTPDHGYPGPTPINGNVPDKVNIPESEILPPKPQNALLPDDMAAEILGYLARFEPILIGIDDKCEKALKSMFNMDDATMEALKNLSGSDPFSKAFSGLFTGLSASFVGQALSQLIMGWPMAIAAAVVALLLAVVSEKGFGNGDKVATVKYYDEALGKEVERPATLIDMILDDHSRPIKHGPKHPFPKPTPKQSTEPVHSSIEAIPPSTISNITNNYYDNTTNKNDSYYGTLSKHELDQISFNKCLDKAMIKLVRDVESGMKTC